MNLSITWGVGCVWQKELGVSLFPPGGAHRAEIWPGLVHQNDVTFTLDVNEPRYLFLCLFDHIVSFSIFSLFPVTATSQRAAVIMRATTGLWLPSPPAMACGWKTRWLEYLLTMGLRYKCTDVLNIVTCSIDTNEGLSLILTETYLTWPFHRILKRLSLLSHRCRYWHLVTTTLGEVDGSMLGRPLWNLKVVFLLLIVHLKLFVTGSGQQVTSPFLVWDGWLLEHRVMKSKN